MKVQRQLAALPRGTAACIGAFDGLHLGHQSLLRRAAALQPRVALVTFDPHPARILAPDRAPSLLQTPAQRERVCTALGIDSLVLLPFTREMASMEPSLFVEQILIAGLRPSAVVVGEDFRFGAGRRGGTKELAALLRPAGIDLAIASELKLDGGDAVTANTDTHTTGIGKSTGPPTKIGSSAIRAALRAGQVAAIPAHLGRTFAIEGKVVRGAGRGRGLGVPTANIAYGDVLLPRTGVYAAALQVVDRRSPLYGDRWPAAANLGTNPTLRDDAAAAKSLEVHALDVDLGERLYGLEVEVGLFERLRDEVRFADLDHLKTAIAGDLNTSRRLVDFAAMAAFWPPPPLVALRDPGTPATRRGLR